MSLKIALEKMISIVKPNWFPVTAHIFSKRHNSFKIYTDKAKRMDEGGHSKYVFRKLKGHVTAPSNEYLVTDVKGREHIYLFSPRAKRYVALSVAEATENFKVASEHDRREVFEEQREKAKLLENKDKLMAFLATIMPIIMLGAVLLVSIFLIQEVDKAVQMGTALGQSLAGVSNNIADAIGNLTYALEHNAIMPNIPPN